VEQLSFPLGRTSLARALKGLPSSPVGPGQFALHGALAHRTRKGIGQAISWLVEQGWLAYDTRGGSPKLRLATRGQEELARRTETPSPPAPSVRAVPAPEEPDAGLQARLEDWRGEVAREAGVAPYVVLPKATLAQVAAQRPSTLEELDAIPGIGPVRLERYGEALLDLVRGAEPSLAGYSEPAPSPTLPEKETLGEGEPDAALFERLRAWRRQTAQEMDRPPFVVFHDSVLRRIAAQRPQTLDALAAIKGVGPVKLEQYGAEILALVRAGAHQDQGATR
jgi:superfamily II DNA helicase RecQ